jgi:hypothetical protein
MAHQPAGAALLERELREIFGPRLQALVAYGLNSSATGHAHHGPHHEAARLQTVAFVTALTLDDLRRCSEKAAGWHGAGLATPLLLAAHEFERSLDAFPLEFGAILADHTVLFGKNPFEDLQMSPGELRRACEVQARSHLLHLREGFLETRGRADALSVLIVRSARPFAALIVTLSRLEGQPASDAEAAGRRTEHALQLAPGAVTEIVKLVHAQEMPSAEAVRLFPAYLNAVERLVQYVDGWDSK